MLCNGADLDMPGLTQTSSAWPQLMQMMASGRVLVPAATHNHASNNNNINGTGGGRAAGHNRVMDQQQNNSNNNNNEGQLTAPLRCPRCDSTNTKFCYYNNYSLSQPRHFCKACKRYWTRGGTLRNVPVGGGCRKNKRVKKPSVTATSNSTTTSADSGCQPLSGTGIPSLSPAAKLNVHAGSRSADNLSSLFNNLIGAASSDTGLGLLSLQNGISTAAYDLPPQMNPLGLGFASSNQQHDSNEDKYSSGFAATSHLTQQLQPSSSSLLHDYSLLRSALSSSTASSILVSSLKQPQRIEDFQSMFPYEALQQASIKGNMEMFKEMKVENEGVNNVIGSNNRTHWQLPFVENGYESIAGAAATAPCDQSSSPFYWNTAAAVGAWPVDSTNFGSSLAPLI